MDLGVDERFAAVHTLTDGTPVRLRPLGPADRERLRAGFERLSPESRYRRFLSPTPRLTERMLTYLTDTDGWNHVAIVAEAFTAQRYHLLEGAARAVALALFEAFPTVEAVEVTLRKPAPPIPATLGSVGIQLRFQREG